MTNLLKDFKLQVRWLCQWQNSANSFLVTSCCVYSYISLNMKKTLLVSYSACGSCLLLLCYLPQHPGKFTENSWQQSCRKVLVHVRGIIKIKTANTYKQKPSDDTSAIFIQAKQSWSVCLFCYLKLFFTLESKHNIRLAEEYWYCLRLIYCCKEVLIFDGKTLF